MTIFQAFVYTWPCLKFRPPKGPNSLFRPPKGLVHASYRGERISDWLTNELFWMLLAVLNAYEPSWKLQVVTLKMATKTYKGVRITHKNLVQNFPAP